MSATPALDSMPPLLPWVYLLNAALLITHEIDSAFWREWELFGLPGGIQLFLALNLALVLILLHGHRCLALGKPSARAYSWLVAGAGVFAGGAHGWFLLAGQPQFRLPASLVLLAAIAIVSLWQAALTARWRAAA
jgi:hypothetical protein